MNIIRWKIFTVTHYLETITRKLPIQLRKTIKSQANQSPVSCKHVFVKPWNKEGHKIMIETHK